MNKTFIEWLQWTKIKDEISIGYTAARMLDEGIGISNWEQPPNQMSINLKASIQLIDGYDVHLKSENGIQPILINPII